jgi:hypothetical protein
MKAILRLALSALVLSSCASVSVIPRYGKLDFGGHLGLNSSSSGSSGKTSFDELGLATDRGAFSGRVDLQAGGTHATFEAAEASRSGSGALVNAMSDGSVTIPAGTNVDSKFDVTQGEAIVTWDLVPGDKLEAGIGLGASVFDIDASVRDPGTGNEIGTKETAPIPLVAARVGLDLGRIDLSALFGGMDAHIGDLNGRFFDIDLMVRYRIFGAAGRRIGALVLGFRYTELDARYDDGSKTVDALVTLGAPYLGLSLGF